MKNMRPTIVITSAAPWDGVTQRPHHVAKELAERGWKVLFIDYPITFLGPVKNRALINRIIPKQLARIVLETETGGSLTVVSPGAILPFGNLSRSINRLNQCIIASQIRRFLPQGCILLSTLPSSADLIPWLHPSLVFYDCVDYHAGFSGMINPDVVNQMERDLVFASKTVFATARTLWIRMRTLHPDVRLVPNAAEVAHFATAVEAPLHPELVPIPEPRVGFIGGIASWVNIQMLAELAITRPNIQLVMIGPVETDVSTLEKLPNVHFLGRKPYQELPQYLHGFDATLYAFVDNELTKGVNPIKVYEYIAAGKEVIASPTYELRKFSDLVWLAEDGAEAAQALDAILAGKRKITPEVCKQFGLDNSWSARTDEIEKAVVDWLPSPVDEEF
jgi:glycosyltransferase involved in cell wall biosynthesis